MIGKFILHNCVAIFLNVHLNSYTSKLSTTLLVVNNSHLQISVRHYFIVVATFSSLDGVIFKDDNIGAVNTWLVNNWYVINIFFLFLNFYIIIGNSLVMILLVSIVIILNFSCSISYKMNYDN